MQIILVEKRECFHVYCGFFSNTARSLWTPGNWFVSVTSFEWSPLACRFRNIEAILWIHLCVRGFKRETFITCPSGWAVTYWPKIIYYACVNLDTKYSTGPIRNVVSKCTVSGIRSIGAGAVLRKHSLYARVVGSGLAGFSAGEPGTRRDASGKGIVAELCVGVDWLGESITLSGQRLSRIWYIFATVSVRYTT